MGYQFHGTKGSDRTVLHPDTHTACRLQAHMRTEISSGLHAEEGWLGEPAASVFQMMLQGCIWRERVSPSPRLTWSLKNGGCHYVYILDIVLLFVHKIWLIYDLGLLESESLGPTANFLKLAIGHNINVWK